MSKEKSKNSEQYSMDLETESVMILHGNIPENDCPFCEDGTLYPERDFHPDIASNEFKMHAKVCDACGAFLANEINMNSFLTDLRLHSDTPYEGTVIVNGKVSNITLH